MIISQTGVFETFVGAPEGGMVTIREENSYTRLLTFRNISGGVLAIVVTKSTDGGVIWDGDVTTFNLPDGAIVGKVPSSGCLLRINASGVASDPGLEIGYTRIDEETDPGTWTTPQL